MRVRVRVCVMVMGRGLCACARVCDGDGEEVRVIGRVRCSPHFTLPPQLPPHLRFRPTPKCAPTTRRTSVSVTATCTTVIDSLLRLPSHSYLPPSYSHLALAPPPLLSPRTHTSPPHTHTSPLPPYSPVWVDVGRKFVSGEPGQGRSGKSLDLI